MVILCVAIAAIVELLKDTENILQAIYSEFPELPLMDAAYKLNNLRMPLYSYGRYKWTK